MRLLKCPKCYSSGFEHLQSYSVCHVCNYNSVEGYRWGKCHDAKAYRALIEQRVGLPLDNEDKERAEKQLAERFLFSPTDQLIARKALQDLPPFRRALIFLRFWRRYSSEKIAKLIQLPTWEVDAIFLKTFAELKEACLNDPSFSVNRLRARVESALLPEAA